MTRHGGREAIAACGGDMRSTIRALILANEFLEYEMRINVSAGYMRGLRHGRFNTQSGQVADDGIQEQNNYNDYRAKQLKRLPWRKRYDWLNVATFVGIAIAAVLLWLFVSRAMADVTYYVALPFT